MIKVGIIGATGYAGNELVRILMNHPEAEVIWYGSKSYEGQKYADVYRNMFEITDDICKGDDLEKLSEDADVIFTATPQGFLAGILTDSVLDKTKIIDLSVYLIEHLLSEDNAFVSALEEIFPYKVGVLVKDDLVHIEFIQVCVKKTLDNGFEFHVYYLLSGSGPVFSFYIVSLMICKIQLYFYHVIIFALK